MLKIKVYTCHRWMQTSNICHHISTTFRRNSNEFFFIHDTLICYHLISVCGRVDFFFDLESKKGRSATSQYSWCACSTTWNTCVARFSKMYAFNSIHCPHVSSATANVFTIHNHFLCYFGKLSSPFLYCLRLLFMRPPFFFLFCFFHFHAVFFSSFGFSIALW